MRFFSVEKCGRVEKVVHRFPHFFLRRDAICNSMWKVWKRLCGKCGKGCPQVSTARPHFLRLMEVLEPVFIKVKK